MSVALLALLALLNLFCVCCGYTDDWYSGSISDVKTNLNNVEAALARLSLAGNSLGGNHAGDICDESLPADLQKLPGPSTPSPQPILQDAPHESSEIAPSSTPERTTQGTVWDCEPVSPATSSREPSSSEAPPMPRISSLSVPATGFSGTKQQETAAALSPQLFEPFGDRNSLPVLEPAESEKSSKTSTTEDYDQRTSPPALIRAVYRGDIDDVIALLAAGHDIEACHPANRRTAAIAATLLGDSKILRVLLDHGASTSAEDRAGRTPLHHAASEGWLVCTNLLLSYGASTDSLDYRLEIPLHRAFRHNREDVATVLLARQADPLVPANRIGANVLHLAVSTSNTGLIDLVLKRIKTVKIDPSCSCQGGRRGYLDCTCYTTYPGVDKEDYTGHSAFQVALLIGSPVIVAKLLKVNPAGAYAPQKVQDWSQERLSSGDPVPWERPLHDAIFRNRPDLVKLLLTGNPGNPSADLPDSHGRTPLEIAIHRGDKESTTALLSARANFGCLCSEHKSLTLWEEGVKIFSTTFLDDIVTSRPDLDLYASAAAREVLNQVQVRGRWETVQKLVAQCTRQDQVGKILDEELTLILAVLSKDTSPEIVKFLLQNGANVDVEAVLDLPRKDLRTWRKPIHYAAALGKLDIATVLLENGASVLSPGGSGWLPLHHAIAYSHATDVRAHTETVRYFWSRTLAKTGCTPHQWLTQYTEDTKRAWKLACRRGSLTTVQLLFEEIVSAELASEMLHEAVRYGRRDISECLLQAYSFSSAMLKSIQKSTFKSHEEGDSAIGVLQNHPKDHEACKALVADAIDQINRSTKRMKRRN